MLNNYMSVGFDAKIALQFHEAREANPKLFFSRGALAYTHTHIHTHCTYTHITTHVYPDTQHTCIPR